MRQEIKNAYGKNVGQFYDDALRTVRKTTIDPQLRRSTVRANYPQGSLGKQFQEQTATRSQKQIAERELRKVQKDAARKYTTKVKAAQKANKVAKAAKIAKLAKVTPVGLAAGIALDKGSEYARKKFVESDTRKVAKLKREAANIDKAMAAARKKNKGK